MGLLGQSAALAGQLDVVAIGGHEHHDVDFTSFDSPVLASFAEDRPIEGLIGASSLVRFAVTFDDRRAAFTLQPYPDDVAAELVEDARGEIGPAPPPFF